MEDGFAGQIPHALQIGVFSQADALPEQRCVPARFADVAQQGADQRALAGTLGADDAENFAFGDRQIDRFERMDGLGALTIGFCNLA